MTLLSNPLLSWPTVEDTEQSRAMQALWQAQIEWTAFVGMNAALAPAQPQPEPEREED
jgi:hypothetical protein